MTKTITPFKDSVSYLQAEFRWLNKRCRRLACLRAANEAAKRSPHWEGAFDEEIAKRATKQAAEFAKQANGLRVTIDARLAATREQRGDTALGLDAISREHDLDADGRLTVLALIVPGISQAFAQQMYEGTSESAFYYITTDMIHDLCVGEPVGMSDALRLRRMWDVDSPLMKSGVVEMTLNATKSRAPVDLLDATLRLSEQAFLTVTGSVR